MINDSVDLNKRLEAAIDIQAEILDQGVIQFEPETDEPEDFNQSPITEMDLPSLS